MTLEDERSTSQPEVTGLLHPDIHRYYPDFVNAIMAACGEDAWVPVKEKLFMDGNPYLRVGAEPGPTVVIPFWIDAPLDTNVMRLHAMGNAVTHEEWRHQRLTRRRIGVCGYFESRSDHLAVVPENASDGWSVSLPPDQKEDGKVVLPGEAVYVEMIAQILEDIHLDDLIVMDFHSKEGLDTLRRHVPRVYHISAFPLFADRTKIMGLSKKDARIFVPDLGAYARDALFSRLTGFPLVRGAKWRPAHSVAEVTLIDDVDLTGTALLAGDEVIDTAGTIFQWLEDLKTNRGVSEVHIFSTSGKFSGPAISRIRDAFNRGLLDSLMVTDNLPSASMIKLFPNARTVPVISLFSRVLKTILSPDGIEKDPYHIHRYLFEPEAPEQIEIRLTSQIPVTQK